MSRNDINFFYLKVRRNERATVTFIVKSSLINAHQLWGPQISFFQASNRLGRSKYKCKYEYQYGRLVFVTFELPFFSFSILFKKYNSFVNNTYSKTDTKSTQIQTNSLWITKCCLGQPCSKIYWQVFLLLKLNWQIPIFPPLLIWGGNWKGNVRTLWLSSFMYVTQYWI